MKTYDDDDDNNDAETMSTTRADMYLTLEEERHAGFGSGGGLWQLRWRT